MQQPQDLCLTARVTSGHFSGQPRGWPAEIGPKPRQWEEDTGPPRGGHVRIELPRQEVGGEAELLDQAKEKITQETPAPQNAHCVQTVRVLAP